MACSTSLKTTSGAHIVVKSLARSPPVYLGEEREGRILRTLFPEVSEEVHHRLVQDTECPLFMSGELAEVLKRVKSERPPGRIGSERFWVGARDRCFLASPPDIGPRPLRRSRLLPASSPAICRQ